MYTNVEVRFEGDVYIAFIVAAVASAVVLNFDISCTTSRQGRGLIAVQVINIDLTNKLACETGRVAEVIS